MSIGISMDFTQMLVHACNVEQNEEIGGYIKCLVIICISVAGNKAELKNFPSQ